MENSFHGQAKPVTDDNGRSGWDHDLVRPGGDRVDHWGAGPNTRELLAALEEEREELDRVINAVRTRVHLGSMRDRISHGNGVDRDASPQSGGPYYGLSIPEAARRYLESESKPKTTAEICNALKGGGLVSHAQNFAATVYGSLNRSKEIRRIRKKWRLVQESAEAQQSA